MFLPVFENKVVSLQPDEHYTHSDCKIQFNMAKETWKDIVGYEGLYQISSEGRVKRLPRWSIDTLGRKRVIFKVGVDIFL